MKFSYVSHTGVIPASRYQESPTFPFVSNFSSAEFIRTRHHNPPLGLWICRAENESFSFWVLRSGLQLWKPNFLVFGPASLKKSILRVRPQRGYLFLSADCCTAVETTHLQNQLDPFLGVHDKMIITFKLLKMRKCLTQGADESSSILRLTSFLATKHKTLKHLINLLITNII